MRQDDTMHLSFEFFPPADQAGRDRLITVAQKLASYQPNYFSVTFGAGGGKQQKTFDMVQTLNAADYQVMPHLTCIGLKREEIAEILSFYRSIGVKRILAIRGDLPPGVDHHDGDFNSAYELVEFIRNTTSDYFHIVVAAYPEMHPDAKTVEHAVDYFCRKAALADEAITQYFFNADAYHFYRNLCHKKGVDIPIHVGIMPISDLEKLLRFSKVCQAEVPRWLVKKLSSYQDQESVVQFGVEFITHFCEKLLANDAPGLHFYTLNQIAPTCDILESLNIKIPVANA